MSLYSISVNFVCKSSGCGASFKYVDQFIEHKKEKHFHEFQTIKSITFEEVTTSVPMNQHKRGNLVESTPPEPLDFENSYTLSKKRKLEHEPPTPALLSNVHPVAQKRKNPGGSDESFAYNNANNDVDIALALDDDGSCNENKNENAEFFDNDIEISNLMSSNLSEQGQGWLSSLSTTTNPPVIPQLESKIFSCNVCGHTFQTPPEFTSLLTVQSNPNAAAEGDNDLFTMKCPRKNCGRKTKSKAPLLNNTKSEQWNKPLTSTVSVAAASTKANNSAPGPSPLSVSKQAPGVAAKAGTGARARTGPPAEPEPARPFLCQKDNCGSSFVKLSSLNFHMKTRHSKDGTGGKKFSCEVCEKSFYTKNDLKRHVVVHSEETPFKCDHPGCTFAYKLKSKLTKHQRNVHGE